MDLGVWHAIGALSDMGGNVLRVPMGAVINDGKFFHFSYSRQYWDFFRKTPPSSRNPCDAVSGQIEAHAEDGVIDYASDAVLKRRQRFGGGKA